MGNRQDTARHLSEPLLTQDNGAPTTGRGLPPPPKKKSSITTKRRKRKDGYGSITNHGLPPPPRTSEHKSFHTHNGHAPNTGGGLPDIPRCVVCDKSAAHASVVHEGQLFHKACFRCKTCNTWVNPATAVLDQSRKALLCMSCHEQATLKEITKRIRPKQELTKQMKIINELVQTEESFVGYVSALQDCFFNPIQRLQNPKFEFNAQIAVFLNVVSQIIKLNGRFLKEIKDVQNLRESHAQETQVAEIFQNYSKLFVIYAQYARNYGAYMDTVNEICEESYSFQQFMDKQRQDPRCNQQPLSSLLIMPVQRIPRYILLLGELKKRCSKDDTRFPKLQSAINSLQITANHVNEGVRAREERMKLMDLEKEFRGDVQLVAPNRFLLKTGTLWKMNRRGKAQTYLWHLFSDMLTYSEATAVGLKLHRRMDLKRLMISDSTEYAHAFEVGSSSKSFAVCARSDAERDEWRAAIAKALRDLRERLDTQDRAAEVAPKWASDKSTKTCQFCNEKFSLFKWRHHCRSCGAVVCDPCSRNRRLMPKINTRRVVRVCNACEDHFLHRERVVAAERRLSRASESHITYAPSVVTTDVSSNEDPSDDESSLSSWSIATRASSPTAVELRLDLFDPTSRAANSIIEEERTYLDQLLILHGHVCEPLMDFLAKKKVKDDTRFRTLTRQSSVNGPVLAHLASAIEKIRDLGARLCDELEESLRATLTRTYEWKIGSVLLTYQDYFDAHVAFASNLPDAVTFFADPLFQDFINTVHKNRSMKGLSVQQYLDMPAYKIDDLVSQLTTYLEVLEAAERPSHSNGFHHGDYVASSAKEELESKERAELDIACKADVRPTNDVLRMVKTTASEMRPYVDAKNTQIMRLLQSQFLGDIDLMHGGNRALIHHSQLEKVSRSRNILYRFHLFSDMITYSDERAAGFYLHRILPLQQVEIIEYSTKGRKNAFQILSSAKSFEVVCENERDKQIWIRFLRQRLKSVRAKHGRYPVAPVWVPDSASDECSMCEHKFSCLCNRRHHCRSCGSLVCNDCSKKRMLLPHVNASKSVRVCDECYVPPAF